MQLSAYRVERCILMTLEIRRTTEGTENSEKRKRFDPQIAQIFADSSRGNWNANGREEEKKMRTCSGGTGVSPVLGTSHGRDARATGTAPEFNLRKSAQSANQSFCLLCVLCALCGSPAFSAERGPFRGRGEIFLFSFEFSKMIARPRSGLNLRRWRASFGL